MTKAKGNRSKAIYWLTDEDIENAGVNPKDVSHKAFELIAKDISEYLDDSFSAALYDSLSVRLRDD
jgi:hypothetical protein